MNNFFNKNIFLSSHSLTTQIVIINIIFSFVAFVFLIIFNIYLIKNNNILKKLLEESNKELLNITDYLEDGAIYKPRVINEETKEAFFTLEPQLDPYRSQEYIYNNYLNQKYEIRIYDTTLSKYVDTNELYIPEDVFEIDTVKSKENENLFSIYKKFYFRIYNDFQDNFNLKQIKKNISPKKNDITLIIKSIKEQAKISNFFIEDDLLYVNLINPLIKNNNVYGVVLIKSLLSETENIYASFSFNMFNFLIIIIISIFVISVIFTRSIIVPLKTLTKLVNFEQSKTKIPNNNLEYPIRSDEIGKLSSNIENMSLKLKQRINELENFAADVAHELKNPLTSLKSSTEVLSNVNIHKNDKDILLKNLDQDLIRMDRIISDISNYTRTKAEVEKQKYSKFDLIKLIEELKLSFFQNKKNIKLVTKFENNKIFINSNFDKLAQVFINLIENAISFSSINSKILIQQTCHDNMIIVYMTDQGIGIDEKLKDKIFERFYTDRNNKNDYHSGLGLSISKQIIESLGGSIRLHKNELEEYKGACFKLELPIKA